ncbi:MAG: Ig-like domain-containing protein, partial [Myxococcales bacterium]|nr:Ig-like domain-containing protein [Myxococcales bacterium]
MRTFPSLTLPLWLTLTGCSLIVAPDAGLIGDGDGGGGNGSGGQPSGGSGGENPQGGGGSNPQGGGGSNPGGFGGEGGFGGVGGMGGQGGGPECTTADTCPDPSGPCEVATCTEGVCGFAPVPLGTVTAVQTAFDCQENQCDGAGAVVSVDDDTDVPVDNNACTGDVCTAGVPSNPDLPAGTTCGAGLTCDGAGTCGGCTLPSQCPGTDDECKTRTCSGTGQCGFNFTAAGTDVAAQIDGDCSVDECDGIGNIVATVDNGDIPVDNLDCTTDECNAGVPENNPVDEGDACDDNGGSVCDDSGVCVECNVALDCGITTDCQIFSCTAGNTCNTMNVANGTPTGSQTAGNCLVNQCNGNGAAVDVADNGDLPVDNLDCTLDQCNAGVPSNPDGPSGVACNDLGGTVCNATGDCVECLMASTCPGVDTECQTRTCSVAGACGFNFATSGTQTSMQTAGNCQLNVCNGSGAAGNVVDDTDVPIDANECTDNICTNGVPSNPNSAPGTVCSTGFCNGSGACVECTLGSQCPSGVCTGNVCQAASCSDGTQNGLETDTDCGGGTCPDCTTGQDCLVGADCVSNSCTLFFCDAVSVLSTAPADAATNTAVAPLNLVVTFSGPVNPASIVLDTTLDDGPCTGTLQVSTDDFATCIPMTSAAPTMSGGNTVATFTANPRHSFGSTYKFRVTTG